MDIDKLPENDMKALNIEIFLTMKKRKYYMFIAALMVINITLFIALSTIEGNATHKFNVALKIIGIGTIMLGFGLGLLTDLIPYKNLHYSEKYFQVSLIGIFVIQILLIPTQILLSMFPIH